MTMVVGHEPASCRVALSGLGRHLNYSESAKRPPPTDAEQAPPALRRHSERWSAQPKRYVDHLGLAFRAHRKSTLLEDFQHRDIVRQDLGDQFLHPGVTRDRGEMMQECPADAVALVFVD